jgi:hypothetical protein
MADAIQILVRGLVVVLAAGALEMFALVALNYVRTRRARA